MSGDRTAQAPVLGLVDDPVKVEFREACNELWSSQICLALIYGRDLMICKDCLALFHADDSAATHPQDSIEQLVKLCFNEGISNQDRFFSKLWTLAIKLLPVFGLLLTPVMSTVHKEPPKSKEKVKDSLNDWNSSRIHILEEELLRLQRDNNRLEQELVALQEQSCNMLSLYIEQNAKTTKVRLQATALLKTLINLLTPDDSSTLQVYRRPAKTS